MEFTYDAYQRLLQSLQENGYRFASYHNWQEFDKCVILRHDIDTDIAKALRMAQVEQAYGNSVSSTYFVLLTSDFYNVASMKNLKMLRAIVNCGHEIGLHFDEIQYPEAVGNVELLKKLIIKEVGILSELLGSPVTTVSMHRPSKQILDSNLKIPGIINSYGDDFFKGFKYLSDSRRRWREPVEEIVASGQFRKLHILTHAFWYNEEELNIKQSIESFINRASVDRYQTMSENITDLQNIMSM